MKSVHKVSSHVIKKNRDIYCRRYKIQETLCTGQWCLSPLQTRHLGTSHSSPSCHQLSHCIFLNLNDGLKSLPKINLSKMKVILVLGKARHHRVPTLGFRGAELPGWFNVSPKISSWDEMHEQAHCCYEAANHQLPIAVAFWISE